VTPVLATAGPTAYWYLARGTGAVSLLLLTAVVVLGVLGPLRFAAPRWPRFAIDTLHRDLSLLVIAVLVVHIATSVLDGFAPISWLAAVIPLDSSYRPLWLGLGALSFDLLVALVVTSLVRRRLGYRAWRALHWLAYASWPVAVLHGLGTGTDTSVGWMLALTMVCLAAVLIAVWIRIARSESPSVRGPATVLSILTPLALVIFTVVGPLRPGWARRAGTPATLLAKHSPARVRVAPTPRPALPAGDTLKVPFDATLSGTITQTQALGGAILDLVMRVSGGAHGELRVRLAGAPDGAGGLSLTGSQVDMSAAGLASVLQGRVVSLRGQQFTARVADRTGSTLDLQANLNIDSQSGSVTGTLAASPAGSGGG
jgi:DMSO/TMAO reductase YedYZ heme-binding membrane subunit